MQKRVDWNSQKNGLISQGRGTTASAREAEEKAKKTGWEKFSR